MKSKEKIRNIIRKNYSDVAQKGSSGGCCSGGCSCDGGLVDVYDSSLKIGYTSEDVLDAPVDSNMGLGCGNPIAIANLNKGEVVLDLGSGGGFDSFLFSWNYKRI